jgi:predicted ABC-type ATPase
LPHQLARINIAAVMSKSARSSPRCIIIAGPNGAGKTTFAREFLSKEANIIHFVNQDLIASGLSPLRPELAALAAGRLFLLELHRLVKSRVDFAFESTLSGLVHLGGLKRWKAAGYRIEIVYLRLHSPRLALRRIAARVKQGGHNVPWPMCGVVLTGVGRIFKSLIVFWPTLGACMITLAGILD